MNHPTHLVQSPEAFEAALARNQPYATTACGKACCRADLTLRPSLVTCEACLDKIKTGTDETMVSIEAKTFQDIHRLAASIVGLVASGDSDVLVDEARWRTWLDPSTTKGITGPVGSPSARSRIADIGRVLIEAQAEPLAAFVLSCFEHLTSIVTEVVAPEVVTTSAPTPALDPSNGTPASEPPPTPENLPQDPPTV